MTTFDGSVKPSSAPEPQPPCRLRRRNLASRVDVLSLGAKGTDGRMGIVISLVLIAFGAILTWAVNSSGGRSTRRSSA
jgi:hypothetical protein